MIEGVALHEQGNASLDSLDAHALSDDELEAAIVALHRSNQRSAAHEARMIALFDSRRAYRSDGSRSAAARLARKTGGSRKELGRAVSLGRRLRLMPLVDAALAAGEIMLEHARILGRLAASDRRKVADAFVECEAELVGFAKDLEFGDFVRAVRYWEQRADADGTEETAAAKHTRRHLHVSQTFDGVFAGPLCELASGTVIAPGQIVPLLDRAYIERAVFDGPNRIIELGERTRFFRGGLRRCVEIIHRRCVHSGCDVSAEECDIDHEIEFNDGGLTIQENGKPRCKPDHRYKSRTGSGPGNQRPPPDG